MLSERLRQRLEQLNRQQLPVSASSTSPPAAPPRAVASGLLPAMRGAESLLERGEPAKTESGEHLVIRLPLAELWPGGESRVAGRLEFLRSLGIGDLSADSAAFVEAMPGGVLLLDLETCGLGGAAIFLVGVLQEIDGVLNVELLFARTYAEEKSVVEALWDRIDAANVVVTYNGKSFDWPTVMDRSRRHLLHKTRRLGEPPHVDFLHAARRRWKRQLPDCKLQTIERLVCRRARAGDIPGSQIPAAYDAYVRTGGTSEIEAILRHNAIDLVTLLDIALRVAA